MRMTGEPRARLEVSDDPQSGGLVVDLAGELDMASLPDVAAPLDELLTRRPQPLVLELGGLTFLDSSGVTMLVRIANHFDGVHTRSATQPVRRVIEVLGLAGRFGLDEA
ncbi:MAG: anti-sigma factor antagonist [Blastococcus sp.]|jgi:anti-sigma B factor antagonist|nr:anti-sigma factor antagonist [Blastococcus sp.]